MQNVKLKLKLKLKLTLILTLLLSACSNQLEGLWVIESVEVGDQQMTPVARWIKIEADQVQSSGNGWYQHSVGTYDYDKKASTLVMENTNGYDDPFGAFQIDLEKDQMFWTREEEGMEVKVKLKKAEDIPASPGDQLMGIWDLDQVLVDGEEETANYDSNNNRYLFIRWDKVFTDRNGPDGRLQGIYQIHGHKNELFMVYYGEEGKQERWLFEVKGDKLSLALMNAEFPIIMEYSRIRHFPQ